MRSQCASRFIRWILTSLARTVKATAPLGFNSRFLGPLIGFLMSGKGLEAVQGATPQILGAASAALKHTEAEGYKIVWFAFLPGGIIAVLCCVLFENPKSRMNWTVGESICSCDRLLHDTDSSYALSRRRSAQYARLERADSSRR